MATTHRILTPAEIAAMRAAEPSHLRIPQRDQLFAARATRLEQLTPGHPMADYLASVAQLARAQHRALNAYPGAPMLPSATTLAQAKDHAMPPLAIASHSRDPSWHEVLAQIAHDTRPHLLPAGQKVIDQITAADASWIEDQADRVLHQRELEFDRGAAIFIAGALQVYWANLVIALGESNFGRLDVTNLCPCCGSRPVGSVMRSGGDGRQRYLVCSLCSAEWHFVRIKCATCESTEGIEYVHVEQYGEAIKAETCQQCETYTKLFAPEKNTELEPVADDLASLGLDLALGDTTSFLRASVNLALFPGEDSEAPDAAKALTAGE